MTPLDVEPAELATLCHPWLAGAIVGFDVDGVLAPIVDHADDSRLTPGVRDALDELSATTTVAVISGRSLSSLERLFEFGPKIQVIGSHGAEERWRAVPQLDAQEEARLAELHRLGTAAVAAIGEGAWLEEKATSVVVHTRQADPARVQTPLDELHSQVAALSDVKLKPGSEVVEMMVRAADKGTALITLSQRLGRPARIFLGDDVTDEDAFAALGDNGISVRVGPGETCARYRLADPDAVAAFVALLAQS